MCCGCWIILGWKGENTNAQTRIHKWQGECVQLAFLLLSDTPNELAETIVVWFSSCFRCFNTWCGISWFDRMHKCMHYKIYTNIYMLMLITYKERWFEGDVMMITATTLTTRTTASTTTTTQLCIVSGPIFHLQFVQFESTYFSS